MGLVWCVSKRALALSTTWGGDGDGARFHGYIIVCMRECQHVQTCSPRCKKVDL